MLWFGLQDRFYLILLIEILFFLGQVITTQQEYKAVKIQGLYKDWERQNPLS